MNVLCGLAVCGAGVQCTVAAAGLLVCLLSANEQCTENKEKDTHSCAQTERLGRMDLFNSAGTNQLACTSIAINPAKACE